MTYLISHKKKLKLSDIENILDNNLQIKLSKESTNEIEKSRKYLDEKIKKSNQPIYGINTGFGSLCNVIIKEKDIESLQKNLVMSHACGTGEEVPLEIVRIMLLLKIQAFAYGNSGVSIETVERLLYFFNNSIFPVIYEQGSLGASGDLSPLAHLSLPLIGLGEVNYRGDKIETQNLYSQLNINPISLKSKEGLALLNGTQFMSAYSVMCLIKSRKINKQADYISAISLDAFDGKTEPFEEILHKIRPHRGQLETAKNIREIISGSEIAVQEKKQVQDPYSFRCIPQVHGASKDTHNFVSETIETEINSVTDNPTVFPEEDKILSGGNFHGQPLALALDYLAISIAELGNISERRIFQLISGARGLPPFLISNAGLDSGMMIPQYTAASIVSQSKQLCSPASVDSIVSSNGQEDHVSMGANAATKCLKVILNTERVLAIELLNACQAIEFRRPLKSSKALEKIIKSFKQIVPFLEKDKVMYQEIEASIQFLKKWKN